jgi:hypothetical protein
MIKLKNNSCEESIYNSMEKIKQFIQSEKGKDVLTILIIILVGLGSFELGRLSKESPQKGLKIEYSEKTSTETSTTELSNQLKTQDLPQNAQKPVSVSSGNYFASSRGKKYYPIGCSAGKTIKQENRIYFASATEAEKAGYTLSSSCN